MKSKQHAAAGKLGGQKKVPKGLAILKQTDPEAFKQHYVDMWKKRKKAVEK